MTVNANYSGNVETPRSVVLAGAAKTIVVPVAADNTLTAAGWAFANPTGGAVNCEIYWSDGTTDWLIWRKQVAANDTQVESNFPLRLRRGHSIKVVGAASVCASVILTAAFQTT